MGDLWLMLRWGFRLVLIAILSIALLDFDRNDYEPTYEYKKILFEGEKCR